MRAIVAYPGDFWILVGSTVLVQASGLIFLWAIFRRIPTINGWDFWQVGLMYALVYVAEGVTSLFFNGLWALTGMVNRGEFDRLLVRPYSVLAQVMSSNIGVNGLGNVVLGGAMTGIALAHLDVAWDAGRVLLAIALLVGAVGVKVGLTIASNASGFWIPGPYSLFALSIHQVGELARYPLTIYSTLIRGLLTFVLPFAFMSYFPVSALLGVGEHPWLGYLTPLVAVWTIWVGVWLTRRGLRRYESAGN
ncbi:MAG: ABC-2 family transporter protein [Brevundimonas sp.]